MPKTVEVLPDKAALIQRALDLVLAKINAALQQQGQCTIALSGGSTPKPLYEAIAVQQLPWKDIHVFWGDERYVPSDHPDSNQNMARQAWLDRVDIPSDNIHPIPTDANQPATAAQQYEQQIKKFFKTPQGSFPSLDIILLGMGDDGHTASLFPYTEALQVSEQLVTVGNKDGQPRLTFTASLINQARCVIFIVSGAGKQAAIAKVFASPGIHQGIDRPEDLDNAYPARLIHPQGELWWLLDEAAGQHLNILQTDTP